MMVPVGSSGFNDGSAMFIYKLNLINDYIETELVKNRQMKAICYCFIPTIL